MKIENKIKVNRNASEFRPVALPVNRNEGAINNINVYSNALPHMRRNISPSLTDHSVFVICGVRFCIIIFGSP